jgi:hypothetical protein
LRDRIVQVRLRRGLRGRQNLLALEDVLGIGKLRLRIDHVGLGTGQTQSRQYRIERGETLALRHDVTDINVARHDAS